MRQIDADALTEKYGDWYVEEGSEEGFIGTIKQLIDAQPTIKPERKSYSIEPDGTLTVTLPKGTKRIGRILIEEDGTQYGGLFYPDEE